MVDLAVALLIVWGGVCLPSGSLLGGLGEQELDVLGVASCGSSLRFLWCGQLPAFHWQGCDFGVLGWAANVSFW